MSLYILDTDHFSLQQRNHPQVIARLRVTPPTDVAITIITVEEQLRGRFAQIRHAKTEPERVQACLWLRKTLSWLGRFPVLDYDDGAARIYQLLRQQKLRVSSQDLRIAATTLSTGGVPVTRNAVDFSQVPGLLTQNWTT